MRTRTILLAIGLVGGCAQHATKKTSAPATPTSDDFNRGNAFIDKGSNNDSAFYYFNRVTQTSRDSLLVATSYAYMASIQQDAADYYGCQESALEGLRHVDEKDERYHYCLSSIYNELGASSSGLKNYSAAIEYYELAMKFQSEEDRKATFQNNIAVAYRQKGEYGKAIDILQRAIVKQKRNTTDYARMLNNLASLKWKRDPHYNPVPELMQALQIRMREKHDLGVTSSYNHLSDYYLAGRRDSALYYSRKMYDFAQRTNSADNKLDALRKLISLETGEASKRYFTRYEQLRDSIYDARSAAKNQYALIKYQSEKNKAENLLLQRDNSQKEWELFRQRIWMYGIGAAVIVIIAGIVWWSRKNRREVEWRSQAAIRESQLKTSQRVHDVVANGLYRIMSEIEHSETIEKEPLLDKVEHLYERSRDISYEPADPEGSTRQKIHDTITAFASEDIKVSVIGNDQAFWDAAGEPAAKELEQVLQELMINMSKHSGAKYVVVSFERGEQALTVSYRDNGTGFGPELRFGNGLRSTENRIYGLGGKLNFNSEPGMGVSINIQIPIRNT